MGVSDYGSFGKIFRGSDSAGVLSGRFGRSRIQPGLPRRLDLLPRRLLVIRGEHVARAGEGGVAPGMVQHVRRSGGRLRPLRRRDDIPHRRGEIRGGGDGRPGQDLLSGSRQQGYPLVGHLLRIREHRDNHPGHRGKPDNSDVGKLARLLLRPLHRGAGGRAGSRRGGGGHVQGIHAHILYSQKERRIRQERQDPSGGRVHQRRLRHRRSVFRNVRRAPPLLLRGQGQRVQGDMELHSETGVQGMLLLPSAGGLRLRGHEVRNDRELRRRAGLRGRPDRIGDLGQERLGHRGKEGRPGHLGHDLPGGKGPGMLLRRGDELRGRGNHAYRRHRRLGDLEKRYALRQAGRVRGQVLLLRFSPARTDNKGFLFRPGGPAGERILFHVDGGREHALVQALRRSLHRRGRLLRRKGVQHGLFPGHRGRRRRLGVVPGFGHRNGGVEVPGFAVQREFLQHVLPDGGGREGSRRQRLRGGVRHLGGFRERNRRKLRDRLQIGGAGASLVDHILRARGGGYGRFDPRVQAPIARGCLWRTSRKETERTEG